MEALAQLYPLGTSVQHTGHVDARTGAPALYVVQGYWRGGVRLLHPGTGTTHVASPGELLAPCGASWHGLRPGAPDCGCGWGDLCTAPLDMSGQRATV